MPAFGVPCVYEKSVNDKFCMFVLIECLCICMCVSIKQVVLYVCSYVTMVFTYQLHSASGPHSGVYSVCACVCV